MNTRPSPRRARLSLARLAEAHIDAVSILAEAGQASELGGLYGVWASEIPDQPLRLERAKSGFVLTGSKMFWTGAGLIDRARITVCAPDQRLIDINLRANSDSIIFDPRLDHQRIR